MSKMNMMNWKQFTRLVGTLAALAMVLGQSPLRADTITCTRTCNFGPGDVLDNLQVKRGGVATLNGTRVTGNIIVEDGGRLYLKNGVEVEGNVQAFGASWASIKSAVIGGSVQIKNTPNIVVKNNVVGGDVQLENNVARLPETLIGGNVIGGNLQLYKNNFTGRQGIISANDVFGNLQLVNNRGGTIVVNNNYVESALQCGDNKSRIIGSGNDAGDLECPYLR